MFHILLRPFRIIRICYQILILFWLLASPHSHRFARFWYEGRQRMKMRVKEKGRGYDGERGSRKVRRGGMAKEGENMPINIFKRVS